MEFGKSISLFLIEGSADGRWMCELYGWTGKAYKIPRTHVKNSIDRADLSSTGVYFLFGKNDENDTNQVYIGEAENIYTRLMQHLSEREFWTECVVLFNKDNSLNKAHAKYLENRMYCLAKEAGRYQIENTNIPTQSSLSEQDIAVMEAFIENAKLLLSAVGHKVLESATGSFQSNDKSNIFHLQTTKKIKAMGKPTADGFVVFQGSKVAPNITDSLTKSISNHRQNLIDCNIIDESFIFTQDYLFTSPSLAAAIVVGHSINGRIAWKNELGQTLKDYESL